MKSGGGCARAGIPAINVKTETSAIKMVTARVEGYFLDVGWLSFIDGFIIGVFMVAVPSFFKCSSQQLSIPPLIFHILLHILYTL